MHAEHGVLSLPTCPSSPGQTHHAQPTADTRLAGSQEDMVLLFPGPLPLSVDVAKITCLVPLMIMPKDQGNPRLRQDDRLHQGNPWKK